MRFLLLLALLGAVSADASAQTIYRWADDKGRVHYGDTAPTDRPWVIFRAAPAAQKSPVSTTADKSEQSDKAADELAQRKKTCADARQQLAYLDARAVARPPDDPNRAKSRELESDYQANLAAYERFRATRNAHLGLIAEHCEE